MIISSVPKIDCRSISKAFGGERLDVVRSLAQRFSIEELLGQPELDLHGLVQEILPELSELAATVLVHLESGPGCTLLDGLVLSELDDRTRDLYLVLLAGEVGRPQPTDQAQKRIVWPVTPRRDLTPGHTPSFTERAGEAAFHLDSSYKVWPESNVFLYCHRPASDGGGGNGLLDGEEVLRRLVESEDGEHLYHVLHSYCFAFSVPTSFRRIPEESFREFVLAPVISRHLRLRWRYDSIKDGFAHFRILAGDAILAVDRLHGLIEGARAEAQSRGLMLDTGQCLVTDNHRVLHCRSHFESGERLLLRVRTSETAFEPVGPPPGVMVVDSHRGLEEASSLVGLPFPPDHGARVGHGQPPNAEGR